VAAKLNRQKRGPLSDLGREKLRQGALKYRPWEHSTGPRTPRGKAQARVNGKRRQNGPLSTREMKAELREARTLIRSIQDVCAGITGS
jgi:hypothetical protein